MTFRRLAAYLPLAVLVGAVVHVAGAGFGHAPGGRYSVEFLGSLAAALATALAAAFFAAAFGSLRSPIATARSGVYATATLALLGTAAYGAIELLEGHAGLGGTLRALAASFPVAALVVAIAHRAERAAGRAGVAYAAAVAATRRALAAPLFIVVARRPALAYAVVVRARRGRAPPHFV